MMTTKREYAHSLGLAKMGRGKFSGAAKEAIAKAEAEGMVFSDVAATPSTPREEKKPTVAAPTETPYLTQDEYRFPEAAFYAFRVRDGKKVTVSLKECCNVCRVSLVNHMCDAPTIYSGEPVQIVRQ